MSVELPVVTAIGSCRVTNPLRMAAARGDLMLNQSRVYGYTHSCAEAVQQALYLDGALRIPQTLHPLVMPGAERSDLDAVHRYSDAYIIEVSSAKELRIGSILVQLNYLTRHFSDFFSDRERARSFWHLAGGDTEYDKMRFLEAQPVFGKMSTTDQSLLYALTRQMTSPALLLADLGRLTAMLPNVLFVTHCNAIAENGKPIASRAKFITTLRDALSDCGAAFCDPTELMQSFGQKNALKDQAGSLSHYTEAFEEMLAAHWMETHIRPAMATTRLMESA